MNVNDLKNRINQNYSSMSKGQKRLANYITDFYDKAVFYTAAKLGETVGVSESTVVRFAMSLGYKGYPEFQKALEEMVQGRLDELTVEEINYGKIKKSEVLSQVLESDALKIQETLNDIDELAFETAVDTLLKARKIYVLGIRSCAPLASYLAFYLSYIFDDVILLNTNNASEIFEQMLSINEKDAIIGISFPRYSMRTLKAMEFANNRNAKVITITDTVNSPMNLYSSCNLLAKSQMTTVVESLTAPMSVINALMVALCMKKPSRVAKRMDMIESIWNDYQIYETDELDQVDDKIHMNYEALRDE